jgi:hypothetical protein
VSWRSPATSNGKQSIRLARAVPVSELEAAREVLGSWQRV